MNEHRKVSACVVALAGACAVLPLSVACGGAQQDSGAANAQVGYNQPPPPGYPAQPGYPQQQPPPPGYAPQPGYPQQQPPPPGYAPQPGYPQQQPGYPPPQAAPGYPPAPGQPAPSGSAPAPLAPTDPGSLQGILQGLQNALQGQTAPQNGGGVAGDVAMMGLKAYALHAAPNMQQEQNPMEQTLQQGQHAVIMFTMQSGRCYSIVGFSPPGQVADLDLNLLAPPLYMTLAGQDLSHNNTPVIGTASQPMCPVIAFPLQYKLDVYARQGSGVVAVALYSKPK